MTVLLAEIPAFDPTANGGAGADIVLRFGSESYTHPSAPGEYLGVIQRSKALVPSYVREAMSGAEEFGGAKVTVASLPVANTGDLDFIISNNLALDGRGRARLLLGDSVSTPYGQFVPIFSGLVDKVQAGRLSLEFIWRDAMALLEDPLTDKKFAGTNVGHVGIEGTEDDLKGASKPVVYGRALNVPAPFVNRGDDIYQVSDRGPVTITKAYDKGAELGAGVARTTLALLQSTTPTAGNADTFAGNATEGAYFRLGFPASGDATADVTEGATAADRTVARVWARILTERCGVAAADIVEADLVALDTAAPGEVGIWAGTDGMTRREALDMIASAVGAVYWVTPEGKWRIKQFAEPSGDPVLTLVQATNRRPLGPTDADILSLDPAEWPLPAHELTLKWGRCYRTLSLDAMADRVEELDNDRKAFLSQEYRKAAVNDAPVKVLHPKARTLEQVSMLVSRTDAEAEAARRLALFKTNRRCWEVSCTARPEVAAVVDLMSVVKIVHPRFGLQNGKLFRVISIAVDQKTGILSMEVWG